MTLSNSIRTATALLAMLTGFTTGISAQYGPRLERSDVSGAARAGSGLVSAKPVSPDPASRSRSMTLFENLTVDSLTNQVSYEQRLYRNPMRGLVTLYENRPSRMGTEFIPLYQGVPIARYRLAPTFETITMSRKDRAKWARSTPFQARRYQFDFRLQPEFIANFGYREQTVQSKTNILLQSQLYLSRGLVLNWGVLFPLINDIDNQKLNVRPAPIYLNQFLALDQRDFLSISAGLFYNDNYGLNVQYRHTDLTEPWSYGVETGLTGFYYFPENEFYYDPLKQFMLLADVAYRIDPQNITLKLAGGQYLYQDRGFRFDLIRQFSDVEVGFYVMKTGNGSTAGFNFAIPIPPGRIAQTKQFRLRSTEEFRWEYNYSRGYNIGTRYKVGTPLDALLRQYHHGYLTNQVR